MIKIGTSSLWEIKYRPQTVDDLIIPDNIKNLFKQYIEDGEIPNFILASTSGRGKTSTAIAICNDIGSDVLMINGSKDTQIDNMRYKVTQYASTASYGDGGKVVIIDEGEMLSAAAQSALKGIVESVESNCRFIMTTNNISKVDEFLMSRFRLVDYNFSQKETKNLIISYYKRVCWILENEGIKYDKKTVAEFVQKMYPDFRKTINRLQNFVKMYGEVTDAIFQTMDEAQFDSLIEEIRNKKFTNARKIIANIDSSMFYTMFYNKLDDLLVDQAKPTAVMILGRYAYESALSVAPEISLCACVTEIMKEVQFK